MTRTNSVSTTTTATAGTWLHTAAPEVFTPFALTVQEVGGERRFTLEVCGGPQACELRRGSLRLKWVSPSQPDRITERTWWGWIGGREVLPKDFAW